MRAARATAACLGMLAAGIAPAAAGPLPASSPAPSWLAVHTIVRVEPKLSFLIGSADRANLFAPAIAGANVRFLFRFRDPYADGQLKLEVQRLTAIEAQDRLLAMLAASFDARSVRSELDKYEVRREWDNPRTKVERIEAAVGEVYNHPGPRHAGDGNVVAAAFRARYATADYYFGGTEEQGFEGPARRFDLALQYARGTHRRPVVDGVPDNGSKYLLSLTPTWIFPLSRDGRTNGYVSYSSSVHGYEGIRPALHADDYELALVRQASRNLYLELHLNTLTKQGVTAPQLLPYSMNHADVDLVVKIWVRRNPVPHHR